MPVDESPDESTPTATAAADVRLSPPSVEGDAPQRVLLIDDEVMIHHLVRARLAGEPIVLQTAATAAEGLAVARRINPDVILLDVELGPDAGEGAPADGRDGYDVCRELKSDPATSQAQVIFLSALATAAQKTLGLDLGAVDYVAKPFDPAELRARVRACLRTKRLLDLLATRAMLDGLTGLWNRAYLNDRLSSEASRSRRTGSPLAVILLDIDRFKSINDTHGHPFGDVVLRQVARALTDGCRHVDAVCRYGGEEFAVVAVGADGAGSLILAERLRAGIAGLNPVNAAGQAVAVTASIGVSPVVAVDGDRDGSAAVDRADRCLYQAKQAGRNRVVVATVPPASEANAVRVAVAA